MWTDNQIAEMRRTLLDWYDCEGRTLPWRVRPEDRDAGLRPDPYAIWLSEIMLQQTTIAHGTPYWYKFLQLYPTVEDLADAPLDDVLTHWAGLGYYARARNLHKCAKIIATEMSGEFPSTKAELLKLPGIGDYTASTIAAICFDEPTSIVDGNVERVIARLHCVDTPLPKGKSEIKRLAATLADPGRPGDYGQALMDLGATLCAPRSPSCMICPWLELCQAADRGVQTQYPKKSPKKSKPIRHAHAFVMIRDHAVWLRKRPETGLLGGMMEVPTSEWIEAETSVDYPLDSDWVTVPSPIRHIFTHIDLRLIVHRAEVSENPYGNGHWVEFERLDEVALPSLFRKVLDSTNL